VTSPASVASDERLRLFLALVLPGDTLDVLTAWQAAHLRGGRIVPRENLHVTLAFLGSRPAGELGAVVGVLGRAAAAAGPVALEVERYRETRAVGMLVLRDLTGEATRLAEQVGKSLEQLGALRRERRPWLPHVTVLRHRSPPRLAPSLPGIGRVAPSEAAAFLSRLHPTGARYEVLESCVLGG
jgi:RNA 2',3'-cyclic 3'-phosphodiesterase